MRMQANKSRCSSSNKMILVHPSWQFELVSPMQNCFSWIMWSSGWSVVAMNWIIVSFTHTLIKSQSPVHTRRASRPSFGQRNFSCVGRVWGPAVTEGGLWAGPEWVGRHRLVPGLCLLAAWDVVGCVHVCLGGCLFRRRPPIWGWTAVLSTSSESFPTWTRSKK